MSELTLSDRSRLVELEAVVELGMQTFVEVGQALMEIRDARLYREAHGTFKAYLDERWGMSRANGYRMIDAAQVAELVSPMGDIQNERQARELVPLLADETAVIEVWRELREEYGDDVTATLIRERVGVELKRERVRQSSHEKQAYAAAEHAEHVQRWQEFAAGLDPGAVVWQRPAPDEALEREIADAEQVAQAAETKARDARKRVRALTTGRPGGPPVGFALTLASPGSQFIDEHGHTYVSPDGERVAYVGRGRPFRPGWQAWGDEMGELPP